MKVRNYMQALAVSALLWHPNEAVFADVETEKDGLVSLLAANELPSQAPCCEKPLCEYTGRFQIGGNYTYAWITPDGNSTTRGNMGGCQAIYEYRPMNFFYGAAAFSWRMGTTENGPTERKVQDFNVQERLGYTVSKKLTNSRLTVFTGIGARHLAETVSVGAASVDYDYTEFYVPVGFLFENQVSSFFSWGCNFQWMPQIFPMVSIEPLGGARWDLTYQIENFFAEAPLKFTAYSERFSLIISPFVESWHDGRSTAVTDFGLALGLPGNTYLFTGVNVNLGISF